MRILPAVIIAGAFNLITGCATIDWSALRYASKMEIADIDPFSARLAVAISSQAEIIGYWVFDVKLTNSDTVLIDDAFKMTETEDPVEALALPAAARRLGPRIYRFEKEEAGRLAKTLKELDLYYQDSLARREAGEGPTYTFSIGASFFDKSSDENGGYFCVADSRNDLSIWGRVSVAEEYRRIINDKRVDRVFGEGLAEACREKAFTPDATAHKE